ncbi:DoxX family protein [Pseudonocardia saturnea]
MTTGAIDQVLRTGLHHRAPRPAAVVRVVAGILFVVFGVPKFTDHARWVVDFGTYGLPESSLLVYGTGLVEVLGGLALVVGAGVRVVAALLALVMAGAVIGGGIVGGNPASLTLAPALLAASVFVFWSAGRARR